MRMGKTQRVENAWILFRHICASENELIASSQVSSLAAIRPRSYAFWHRRQLPGNLNRGHEREQKRKSQTNATRTLAWGRPRPRIFTHRHLLFPSHVPARFNVAISAYSLAAPAAAGEPFRLSVALESNLLQNSAFGRGLPR